MAERTDERTAGDDATIDDDELGVDVDALTGEPDASSASRSGAADGVADESPGLLSRLRPSGFTGSLAGLPSGRSVLLTFGVVLVSVLLANSVPLLGIVGGPVGIFAGAFVLGLASGTARYVEFALAGALVGGLGAFQGTLFRIAAFADVGFAPVFALAGGAGLVLAILGHYFGRDLRNGLTAGVE
jgi:hypothetical protein